MAGEETLTCCHCGCKLISFGTTTITVRQDMRITVKDAARGQGVIHCPSCGTEKPIDLARLQGF